MSDPISRRSFIQTSALLLGAAGTLNAQVEPEPAPHEAIIVDSKGDLHVCQWNSGSVYPYKLHRIS
jgi:hypothetical protein